MESTQEKKAKHAARVASVSLAHLMPLTNMHVLKCVKPLQKRCQVLNRFSFIRAKTFYCSPGAKTI
jgi:hypothetical protein